VVGVAKVTTAVHCAEPTGATVGQVIEHAAVLLITVEVAVPELSAGLNSLVELEIVAVFESTEPVVAPAFTLNVRVNDALALAGSVAIVQLTEPVALPEAGALQVNIGPVS